MADSELQQLAQAAGLSLRWTDYRNCERTVSDEALRRILAALGLRGETVQDRAESWQRLDAESADPQLPLRTAQTGQPIPLPAAAAGLPYRIELENGGTLEGRCNGELPGIAAPGYHRLLLDDQAPVTLAVAPPRCFGIGDLGERRRWGLTAQIYGLRRAGDGGIGDYGSVAELARLAAGQGADAVAISPTHALFTAQPQRHSPYAPSTRLLGNALLADPAAVFTPREVEATLHRIGLLPSYAALEASPLIDPLASARAKLQLFQALHAQLQDAGLRADFEQYCREAGEVLVEHARFEALQHQHLEIDAHKAYWREWAPSYRRPDASGVAAFARDHAPQVEFQMFLQWLVDRSAAQAQAQARQAGMAIGLIGDLAVGTDSGGSHAWSRQDDLLLDLRIGAPPDLLNVKGQDWGLTAFSPRALRRNGYRAFIELLRASLRHVGGIRLDHVFSLLRLWLIPAGVAADQGAYLRYPVADLLRLIALESWRHRAVVIGEDLGTIPPGFQRDLSDAGLSGMRVLWFERDHGYFVEPARWPAGAVAMTTTHDLPTVAGWWCGRDIDWRHRLDLLDIGVDEPTARQLRRQDRQALWAAFTHAGVAAGPEPAEDEGGKVAQAAAAFIGATPAPLALLPVEDALGLPEQPNIPGTTDEHPNWRRRLPSELSAAFAAPAARERLAALDARRRRY